MNEYKVGDWIKILDDSQECIKKVIDIKNITRNSGFSLNSYHLELLIFDGGEISAGWVRHATPNEIETAKGIGYD